MATAKSTESKPVKIALNVIKADHALQPRVEMDAEHWNRMARAYVEGDDVPPPVHLFFDGKFYWLVDGFHRYKAMWSIRHMGAKFTHIKAFVHSGTKQEAVAYAAQANLDNRSKPMNDADRKKAMWMLMDLPEWREKSSAAIGKTFGLSSGASKKYWVEYFSAAGLPVPKVALNSLGATCPTSTRSRTNSRPPAITKARNKYWADLDGKTHYLAANDAAKASEKLTEILAEKARARRYYESAGGVVGALANRHVVTSSAFGEGNAFTNAGLSGLGVAGIAVVWESFQSKSGAVAAIGRAVCCRAKLGVDRVVVLCPAENGPADVMELGRKAGVEFMTIEEFVASLKGEQEPTQ